MLSCCDFVVMYSRLSLIFVSRRTSDSLPPAGRHDKFAGRHNQQLVIEETNAPPIGAAHHIWLGPIQGRSILRPCAERLRAADNWLHSGRSKARVSAAAAALA
jgi:hypothetical protein